MSLKVHLERTRELVGKPFTVSETIHIKTADDLAKFFWKLDGGDLGKFRYSLVGYNFKVLK